VLTWVGLFAAAFGLRFAGLPAWKGVVSMVGLVGIVPGLLAFWAILAVAAYSEKKRHGQNLRRIPIRPSERSPTERSDRGREAAAPVETKER